MYKEPRTTNTHQIRWRRRHSFTQNDGETPPRIASFPTYVDIGWCHLLADYWSMDTGESQHEGAKLSRPNKTHKWLLPIFRKYATLVVSRPACRSHSSDIFELDLGRRAGSSWIQMLLISFPLLAIYYSPTKADPYVWAHIQQFNVMRWASTTTTKYDVHKIKQNKAFVLLLLSSWTGQDDDDGGAWSTIGETQLIWYSLKSRVIELLLIKRWT